MLPSKILTYNNKITSYNPPRKRNESSSSNNKIFQKHGLSSNISFKGAPATCFWAGVFGKEWVQKTLAWVNNNKAMTDTISMCVVGMTLKPMLILAKKKTKKDDKQFLATKTIVGSVVDYSIAMAFITPISVAVGRFVKNIDKLQKTNQLPKKLEYLKNKECMSSFKEIAENAPKYATAGLKAAVQIPLILTAMAILFPDNEAAKKKAEKEKAKKAAKTKKGVQ